MARAKVKLAYITNDATRKATFKKRKKGLLKKVSELTTLCGIEACAIVFSPGEARPEVWPSPLGARHVIARYQVTPEVPQTKKKLTQESFTKHRIDKATEQLKKIRRENNEKAITLALLRCVGGMGLHSMTMTNLNEIAWLIEKNLRDITKKMEEMDRELVKAQVYVPEPLAESNGHNPEQGLVDLSSGLEMNTHEHVAFGGHEMLPPVGDFIQNDAFWPQMFMP